MIIKMLLLNIMRKRINPNDGKTLLWNWNDSACIKSFLINYNKAIELDPKYTKGYLNRGITK
jgi:hypothetical protein